MTSSFIRAGRGGFTLLLLLAVVLPASALFAVNWPGPYPGSRILGSNGVCAVWSESPERVAESFGITHYYRGDYARDYIHTGYPRFEIAGGWEHALGTESARRERIDLRLSGENFATSTEFRSMRDSEIRVTYRVHATIAGEIVFEISVFNEGNLPKTIFVEPVIRFRESPLRERRKAYSRTQYTVAEFDSVTIGAGFFGDENISSVESAGGAFPNLRQTLVVSPNSISRSTFVLFSSDVPDARFPDPALTSWDAARAAWQDWLRAGNYPPAADSRVRAAYEAALTALRATVLRGAVPADMTGQFMTRGRPQLYPRDALMTARALLEAGYPDLATEIVQFWNRGIPQKSRGEWYARYDAWRNATPGGDGAPYDLPEWDSNGYYASLLLEIYMRTGKWAGDTGLMRELLDFVLRKQDADGLVTEGGIIEWEGRLPGSNMNLAAGLRHGALICEILGDRRNASRYRAGAAKMERGLTRLFSRRRGAYMDMRDGREQFNTSANFGWIWGYPDHFELAASNAWYRRNTFHLGHGVRYFEADGYGSDLFGFTTGASAQYHAWEGDGTVARDQVKWMMGRSNVYGMMPERILSPEGRDVSPASPLSWCNAEFMAAVGATVAAGDAEFSGHELYPVYALASRLEHLRRVLAALPRRARPAGLSSALAAVDSAVTVARGNDPVAERLRAMHGAVKALRRLGARGAMADLAGLIGALEDRLNRVVWNRSGARWALGIETSSITAGETFSLIAWLGTNAEIAWDSVEFEARDGNEGRMSGMIPAYASGGAVSRDLKFARGELPYATAIRATARGEWKGLPLLSRRTLSLDVHDAYEIDREDAEEGASRVTVRRMRSGEFSARVEAPAGWTIVETRSETTAARVFQITPSDSARAGYATLGVVVAPDRVARRAVSVPVRAAISLEGPWRFRKGDDTAWAQVALSEDGWSPVVVPSQWEEAGHPGYDGYAWYRLSVTVPAEWKDRDLEVVLGAVDDQDWTYWNGRFVGNTKTWNTERRYRIPSRAVRAGGRNVIAIRVLDLAFGGGIWKGPVRIELAR
jgi:hypothetical protein